MNTNRSTVTRWLIRLNLACGFASGIALLLMMVAGAADVIGTNLDIIGLPAQPVPAAFEFMATMMVVNVFLATALAQARRAHIRVEVIVNRFPPAWQKVFEFLAHALSAAMWALIAYYGWLSGIHSTSVGEYATGLINFPTWPARLILGFGATLMAVQCLFDMLGVFSERFRATDVEHRTETPIS